MSHHFTALSRLREHYSNAQRLLLNLLRALQARNAELRAAQQLRLAVETIAQSRERYRSCHEQLLARQSKLEALENTARERKERLEKLVRSKEELMERQLEKHQEHLDNIQRLSSNLAETMMMMPSSYIEDEVSKISSVTPPPPPPTNPNQTKSSRLLEKLQQKKNRKQSGNTIAILKTF